MDRIEYLPPKIHEAWTQGLMSQRTDLMSIPEQFDETHKGDNEYVQHKY